MIEKLPGVTVHKSIKAALTSIAADLEKQHLKTLKAQKNVPKRK